MGTFLSKSILGAWHFQFRRISGFPEYLNLTKGNTGFMLQAYWRSAGKERVHRGERLSACFSLTYSMYKKPSYAFYVFNPFKPLRNPVKWCFPEL